jgi:hypothetical protein
MKRSTENQGLSPERFYGSTILNKHNYRKESSPRLSNTEACKYLDLEEGDVGSKTTCSKWVANNPVPVLDRI